MVVTTEARLVRSELVEIEGRGYYLGELLIGEDSDRPELVKFSGQPDRLARFGEVARMSKITVEADIVAKNDYDNRPYVSLRLHSFGPESRKRQQAS